MSHPDTAKRWFVGLFRDFKYVWYTFLIIVVPSLVLVLLKSPFPFLADWLKLSLSTPWGIVTSIFMHENLQVHFLWNAMFLFLFCVYLAVFNDSIPAELKPNRSKFFAFATFGSAVLANIMFLIIAAFLAPAASSYGASGAVYASLGVVLGFSFGNMIAPGNNLHELFSFYRNRKNLRVVLANSIVVVAFMGLLFASPSVFLSKGANVNIFAHGIAFLAALGITFVYIHRARQK